MATRMEREFERRLEKEKELVILANQQQQSWKKEQAGSNIHLVRAILIIIDNTRFMDFKDFKPSRIALTLQYLTAFINKAFDINPITYMGIAVLEDQVCKPLLSPTINMSQVLNTLDNVKVLPPSAKLSLESCIRTSIRMFEQVPLHASKQILMIQSSPSTNDTEDIFNSIQDIVKAGILVNVVSLTGITYIFRKLAESSGGKCKSVTDPKNYFNALSKLAHPPHFEIDKVEAKLFRISFFKKQTKEQPVLCFCHLQEKLEVFVCSVCHAVLCKVPVICIVCRSQIILPGDLSRHLERVTL